MFVDEFTKYHESQKMNSLFKKMGKDMYLKNQTEEDENKVVNPRSLTLNRIEDLYVKLYKLRGRLKKKNVTK